MEQMHDFIFNPGRWVGEGRISFSSSRDHLRFYTSWWIEKEEKSDVMRCQQQVEMQGAENVVCNQFLIEKISADKFKIQLENEMLGYVEGSGVIDSQTIAWEFRNNGNTEGFEVYELQENGDYMLHAEYSSPDQFRTIIDGRIWKKSPLVTQDE